jgi:hypothetical protein
MRCGHVQQRRRLQLLRFSLLPWQQQQQLLYCRQSTRASSPIGIHLKRLLSLLLRRRQQQRQALQEQKAFCTAKDEWQS